jgi:alkyl hydroperoxide reductase subunit F
MLDSNLIEQLKAVFSVLENSITLEVTHSPDPHQGELLTMLNEVASCSSKINVLEAGDSLLPGFRILKNSSVTGVRFTGIPGGHEFTSLILAILNADGKGKLPDEAIQNRIRRLKGPISISTYISLTCENCPDVVQALNQMALIHSDFHHEMKDGAYLQDEIQRLGIQGVPSVVSNEKLIHSGKINLLDLISALENYFGTSEATAATPADLGQYDMVIIGGGPAGASAAIYSARKGLRTAIIAEKFGGQVQDTRGIENLISVPYTEGPALAAHLSQHMAQYPITMLENRRVSQLHPENPKRIELEGGETLRAQSVIITTGAKWRELGIPGEKEYLGRGVAFCPHCDGPFYKGKKVAVIGGGNSGVEAAIDLSGIVGEVIVFEFNESLKADQVLIDKLESIPNARVITGARTKTIKGDAQKVTHLVYEDRKTQQDLEIELDGIFVQIGLIPNSKFLNGAVQLTPAGEIKVDEKGRTSASGIYAAGDVTTTPYKQIIIAMGEGAKAALAAFEDRILAH